MLNSAFLQRLHCKLPTMFADGPPQVVHSVLQKLALYSEMPEKVAEAANFGTPEFCFFVPGCSNHERTDCFNTAHYRRVGIFGMLGGRICYENQFGRGGRIWGEIFRQLLQEAAQLIRCTVKPGKVRIFTRHHGVVLACRVAC